MRYLVTVEQAREAEARAVAEGHPLPRLMDRAGAAVAAHVAALAPTGPVLVLAGGGNNGGDGWVAAHRLFEAARDVTVLVTSDHATLPSPAREAAAAAIAAGVEWQSADEADVAGLVDRAAVIVDALLGIGAHGAPRAPYAELIAAAGAAACPVVAVDIPSGVDADTGAVHGAAVRADVTVTFGAPKLGCALQPGRGHAGRLAVADIGLPAPAPGQAALPELWTPRDYAALLPIPDWDASKFTRGRVLVVGGAPGLTGAVCLAASGALRTGAGYVTVAVPAPSLPVVESKLTAPVKVALPATADGALAHEAVAAILALTERADAVVLGPGLGRAESTRHVVLEVVRRLDVPLLLDADGLYALGADLSAVAGRGAPTVLTPHAGEAARALARTREHVEDERFGAVRTLAAGSATAVLKGPSTLIAGEGRVVVNPSGGPGLATLGTGDVLSGVAGALLAAGLSPLDAAVVGTYVHGLAGDEASRTLTPLATTAEDVVAYLPRALRFVLEERGRTDLWKDEG